MIGSSVAGRRPTSRQALQALQALDVVGRLQALDDARQAPGA